MMLKHLLYCSTVLISAALVSAASAHSEREHGSNHQHDIKGHVIDELRRQHPALDILGEVVEQQRHHQRRYEQHQDHSYDDRRPHSRDNHGHHDSHNNNNSHGYNPSNRANHSRDFGVTYINDRTLRVYHADYGWTASFRYLCLNDQCYTAHRDGGYYVYDFPAQRGRNYMIKIKVQDEHTPGGQYISSKNIRF